MASIVRQIGPLDSRHVDFQLKPMRTGFVQLHAIKIVFNSPSIAQASEKLEQKLLPAREIPLNVAIWDPRMHKPKALKNPFRGQIVR